MGDGDSCATPCSIPLNYTFGTCEMLVTKTGDIERSVGNVVLASISEDLQIRAVFEEEGGDSGNPRRLGIRRQFWLEAELDEASCYNFELGLGNDALNVSGNDRVNIPTIHERPIYAVRLEHTTPWDIGIDIVIPRASVETSFGWELQRSSWASQTLQIFALRTVGSPEAAYGYLQITPGVCLRS